MQPDEYALKPGDQIQLTPHSPLLLVTHLSDQGQVQQCVWFDENQDFHQWQSQDNPLNPSLLIRHPHSTFEQKSIQPGDQVRLENIDAGKQTPAMLVNSTTPDSAMCYWHNPSQTELLGFAFPLTALEWIDPGSANDDI